MHATVLCRKGSLMKLLTAIMVSITLLLMACHREQASPPPKLFETQREALDKAKALKNTMQQQTEQQRQDVDQQTQ